MRLPNRTDYAIRASLELAANVNQGPLTVAQIAKAQRIPVRYLGAIMTQLRKAGIVMAQRGPDGGYLLARAATKIMLADVIRAVDGALTEVGGARPENLKYQGNSVGLAQVWIAIRAAERQILDQVSLAAVVSGKLPNSVKTLLNGPRAKNSPN
jgi:Rrf2 family protein